MRLTQCVCVCVYTCSRGGHHVNECVDGLHQLGLLSLQSRVVAAGHSQLSLQRLDGGHLRPDDRLRHKHSLSSQWVELEPRLSVTLADYHENVPESS